ncbi:MAG: acyl-homoserine-lactone synthase [Paracoccaceae bacterium]|nr:acyl-homoserine-lactone synthase [Paracoccaceae bacterium]
MIRYLTAQSLARYPCLQDSMFKDRAHQFSRRLKWDVSVDANGWEQDNYDTDTAIYAIWQRKDGRHGGSMRFLPTTGATMINDHFVHVTGHKIVDKNIWETTRFCLAPDAPS